MSIITDAGSAIGKGVTDVGKGVGDAGKGAGQGVMGLGKGAGDAIGVTGGAEKPAEDSSAPTPDTAKASEESSKAIGEGSPQELNSQPGGNPIGQGLGNLGSAGKDLVGKGFSNGFQIAGNVSKDAFDIHKNVATGVANLGGTAIDGVVTAATTGTSAVFDPIANGLKAIEGLEGLGEGVDSINGLSTKALKGLASVTKEAMSVVGNPPTFFDPDRDGVVKFSDTQKGFVLLGLEDQYAKMAAYALHSTFSFSTSDSWNPTANIVSADMPINVSNMSQTRWGKNWGNFERVEWVSDTDVETFFGYRERANWTEYWADSKSYFGTALLIFEWGTTWPFIYGALDSASPLTKQLGAIMRAVILPTIFKSHENAKPDGEKDSSEKVVSSGSEPK